MPRGQPFFRCQRGPWRKWRFDAPRSRQYGIPCSWSDQPWAKPPGTVTEAMIPGFTMRVRVTNRKALLAWFAGQPGETGNHGAAKGWRAAFHMCGGCTGGSIPSCPTRALRFSSSLRPGSRPGRPGNEKPSVYNGLMRFRQRLSGAKGGTVNLTIPWVRSTSHGGKAEASDA